MTSPIKGNSRSESLNWWRILAFLVVLPAYFALFMFVPAGDWAWLRGWLFILTFAGSLLVAVVYLWRVNPDVLAARSKSHKGTKRWDKILLSFFFPPVYLIAPVAALDDGRFHWFPLPWWVSGVGCALFAVGTAIVTWAQSVNKFFEPTVRIQTDRGHHVIDAGPYAIVRRPGYFGAFFYVVGAALCMGSVYALIPAAIVSALLILRTYLEDRTLQSELAGYKDYTIRVRFRLIPRIG